MNAAEIPSPEKDDNEAHNIIVHCNHAGASPSPASVVDIVLQHMKLEQTVGGYTAAEMASDELKTVYQRVAQLLNLGETSDPTLEIALVESATVAWTRLFYPMAHFQTKRVPSSCDNKKTRVILVSEAEYAANVVAACQWAKDHAAGNCNIHWTVLSIPSTRNAEGHSTGMVDLKILEEMLKGQYQYTPKPGSETTITLDPADIALACITHIPTNSGIVNNVEGIGELIAWYNAANPQQDQIPSILYLVDACQSVGQREVNVPQIQCHGLVATGRKFLRGPRGTGFLFVPHQIANRLMPHHLDHVGVPIVAVPPRSQQHDLNIPVENLLEIKPKDGAARFEFYESNVANKLGLGEAILFALDEGIGKIQSSGLALAQDLYQKLDDMEVVQLHHPPLCGIVSFYVPNVPSKTIKQKLWENVEIKFETSLVLATSTPLDSSKTQVPDLLRVSLSYTNSVEEVYAFCQKLDSILTELC